MTQRSNAPPQLLYPPMKECGEMPPYKFVDCDSRSRSSENSRLDTDTVPVSEEKDVLILALSALIGLDPLAAPGVLPQGPEEADRPTADVGAVVPSHNRLDSLTGLVGVVERDGADVVVENVSFDDTVEQMAPDETKFAVDRCCGTASEAPHVTGVVRESGIGMLEEGDSHKPVVDPKVRKKVPDCHIGEAEFLSQGVESKASDGDTEVGQENQFSVLGLIERAAGIEVVDTAEKTVFLALATTFGLLLVLVMTGDVCDQVKRPAEELLANQVQNSGDWSFLGQFMKLVKHVAHARAELLAVFRYEDHIALHVTGSLVVLAVGDFPREIWDEQCRVADPTNCVIENLGGGERLVTAFMCQNPDTSGNHTLNNCV